MISTETPEKIASHAVDGIRHYVDRDIRQVYAWGYILEMLTGQCEYTKEQLATTAKALDAAITEGKI